MTNRVTMNTQSLQKAFPSVYGEFFSCYDLIISSCFSLNWWQEWATHESRQIVTKSKLPLKCYAGIKKIEWDVGIKFSECKFFNIVDKQFDVVDYQKVNKEYEWTMRQIIWFLRENNHTSSIEISFLSEIPRGHSLGFSDTSFAALALWLYLYVWKLKREVLDNYDEFLSSPACEEIIRFAWSLSLRPRYGNTIAQSIRTAFSNSSSVTVTCSERFEHDDSFEDVADNIHCEHYVLADKFWDTLVSDELPFDFGLIFSGIPEDSRQVERFKKADIVDFDKYKSFLHQTILSEQSQEHEIYAMKFLSREPLFTYASDLMILLNVRALYLLSQLFQRWHSPELMYQFIDNINHQRAILEIISGWNSFSDDFVFNFKKYQTHPDECLWITPLYSGKVWWGYLFFLPPGMSRKTLDLTIQEMKIEYPQIELEYCSYLDGDCKDWVQIEQFVSKSIFSHYVQKDKVFFKDNSGRSYVAEYKTIIEKETDCLLIDAIGRKLYFNWVKLTSKELPSQTTSVDVLEILFDTDCEDVTNAEFPTSSYTKNKNEMLGKIVLPLIKFMEEKTGQKFPLICKWSITEFYMKLGKSKTSIGIIKNI